MYYVYYPDSQFEMIFLLATLKKLHAWFQCRFNNNVYRHYSYYLTTMCRAPTLQFEGIYSVRNISLPDTNNTLTSNICGTFNHFSFIKLLSVSMGQPPGFKLLSNYYRLCFIEQNRLQNHNAVNIQSS